MWLVSGDINRSRRALAAGLESPGLGVDSTASAAVNCDDALGC